MNLILLNPPTQAELNLANVMIWITLIMLGLTIVVSLIFPLIKTLNNPKESMKSLLGIAGLLVVLLVFFALPIGELPQMAIDAKISVREFKLVGALINTALLSVVVASAASMFDVFLNIFRS